MASKSMPKVGSPKTEKRHDAGTAMSHRSDGERAGRGRPLAGALFLVLLAFQSACPKPGAGLTHRGRSPDFPSSGIEAYEVEILEPGRTVTAPVPLSQQDYQRALRRMAQYVRLKGSPREAAKRFLRDSLAAEAEIAPVSGTGFYLAEVYQGQVFSMVKVGETGPVSLTPLAEEKLRADYLSYCQRRGGGDCLGLFDDGNYLLAEDRCALTFALAFDSVLAETGEGIARELDPNKLVAMLVWSAVIYMGLLTLPEPTTKAIAATLTIVLIAWLGLSTFWALINGWADTAHRAHIATTFEDLRDAGQEYARVLGTEAARWLILGITALAGSLIGRTIEAAGRAIDAVRAMPGFGIASMQWELQAGGTAALPLASVEVETVAATQEGALAKALASVKMVVTSPAGPGASVAVFKQVTAGGGGNSWGGRVTQVINHQGGNRQVITTNGQRWHLPRDKTPTDIPLQDPVGDELQQAAKQASQDWGSEKLTANERDAINKAFRQGEGWLARLLERQARGRFVQTRLKALFGRRLEFSLNEGVDVVDPATHYQYEILSGTDSNMAEHGRRMATEFFRMITF